MHTNPGHKHISNILYVSRLSQNLLSTPQILHNNFSIDFKDSVRTIFDPIDAEIPKVDMLKNSFYLKGDSLNHHVFFVKAIGSWKHHQFGHFKNNTLKLLGLAGMVQNFLKFESFGGLCESYKEQKTLQLLFPSKSNWRVKEKLELICINACKPMQITSFVDNKFLFWLLMISIE